LAKRRGASALQGEQQQALAGGFAKGQGKGRWSDCVEIRGWNPRHLSADRAIKAHHTCPDQKAHPARPRVDERQCV